MRKGMLACLFQRVTIGQLGQRAPRNCSGGSSPFLVWRCGWSAYLASFSVYPNGKERRFLPRLRERVYLHPHHNTSKPTVSTHEPAALHPHN